MDTEQSQRNRFGTIVAQIKNCHQCYRGGIGNIKAIQRFFKVASGRNNPHEAVYVLKLLQIFGSFLG